MQELLASPGPWKFVFFWGHTPKADGTLGAECFSQWWPAEFEVEGERYATAEHFMMAEKARLFEDEETRRAIIESSHPNQAKSLGRQVRGFDPEVWEGSCRAIVVSANAAKFKAHPNLGDYLLGTGQRILVEASPLDRIWGIGLAANDPRASDPAQWKGTNWLGFALMETRRILACE